VAEIGNGQSRSKFRSSAPCRFEIDGAHLSALLACSTSTRVQPLEIGREVLDVLIR
jgi:hypothetical protein